MNSRIVTLVDDAIMPGGDFSLYVRNTVPAISSGLKLQSKRLTDLAYLFPDLKDKKVEVGFVSGQSKVQFKKRVIL